MLIMCVVGLIKQNRINAESALAENQVADTTEIDSTAMLLSAPELTAMLHSRTAPSKGEIVKSRIPYADSFKKHAPEIGWEWELLAAVCYAESKFNPLAHSKSGAMGLMQLMPKPAAKFGLQDPYDPEQNIEAGAKYIQMLIELYHFVPEKKEKTKFVLASYNAGPAHIMDARRLAKKRGLDPNIWYQNVEYCLYLLKDSAIAADSVVKFGQFKPMQTLLYVHKVLRQYDKFRNAPEYETDSLGNVIIPEDFDTGQETDDISDADITDIPFPNTPLADSIMKDSSAETMFDIFWDR